MAGAEEVPRSGKEAKRSRGWCTENTHSLALKLVGYSIANGSSG